MPSLVRALFALVLVALTPGVTRAQIVPGTIQSTQVPPRDRVPPPTTGTGVIKGRVVDGVTGAPIPRARVRLMGTTRPPMVTTDGAGAFIIKNLPPGAFTLVAEKSTYLLTRFPDAGRTLRAAMGKPIVLAAGQAIDFGQVPLFHAGAITGRVLDANGDLVEMAEVRLLRLTPGGKPQMRSGGSSNDIGEFRIGRLEPGSYLLMASARRSSMMEDVGTVSSPAAVEVAPQPLPTYYPGATAIDLAQPIRVERGQTVSDVEMTLAEGVPSVVTGTVVNETGQPLTGGFLMARANIKEMSFPLDAGATSVRPDGTFRLTLAPGEYTFEARANASAPGAVERTGMVRVTVAGNIDGLTIPVGPPATASGKVIFEGTAPLPPNPQQISFPLFMNSDGINCRQGRMTMAADWTFKVEGLLGTCSRPSSPRFGSWALKSLRIDGQEFDEESITFEPGQRIHNVQVTLTDQRSGATFNVSDESGQPTREYVGLVFQVSKGQVTQNSILTVVPASDEMLALSAALNAGREVRDLLRLQSISSLRPGEYYAIAIDDIGIDDSRDTSTLARLIPAATRITIGDTPDTLISVRRQKLADLLKR